MRKIFLTLTLLFFTTVLSRSAFATSQTSFNFGISGSGDLGNNKSYSLNGLTTTLYAFMGDGHAGNLFYKNGGGDEVGLGIKEGGFDYEVSGAAFLQFTTSGVAGRNQSEYISFGSLQKGETWSLYGSNTLGKRGALLLTGSTADNINISNFVGSYKYLSLGAPTGDFLLSAITVTPSAVTPEPASALIFSTGLIAVAFSVRKKLSGKSSSDRSDQDGQSEPK